MKKERILSVIAGGTMALTSVFGTSVIPVWADEENVVDLEVWSGNGGGYLGSEKGSATYNFYKDLLGIGIIEPYVEWNGGTTYAEQLNLSIASGEMPDLFAPVNGMENDLIKNGALLDLTDLLPEKAPHLWEAVSEDIWDVMKANDPTGEGRIYMIPNVLTYPLCSGMIRQDWLDELGLSMPETQDELVEVLKAFRDQDPNGNGIADEIPTGGRAEARWMDDLFAMYGVAMWEGYPQFDLYDGELTYSAVTPNMRDALEWISELYQEGLIDPETLLNDKAGWEGKVNSNQVGVFFHQGRYSYQYAEACENATGVKAQWVLLPMISADGYDGFYSMRSINGIFWVAKNTDDEARIDAIMTALDAMANPDYREDLFYGVEGMHYEVVDGEKVKLPRDVTKQEVLSLDPDGQMISTVDSFTMTLETINTPERSWAVQQSIDNLATSVDYGKRIASDGMPSSVYEGYHDIENRTLYVEYASKIITGDWPIEKFDEFVEKWYSSGGQEVTDAARAWYNTTYQE